MCRYTSIYLHSKHVEQILYCMNWGPDGRQHIFLQAKLKFFAGYSKSALCKCDLWLSQPFQRTSSLRGRFLPSPCCRVQNPPAGGSFSNGENYQWSTAKLRLFASLGSTIKLQSKEIHVETKPPLRTVFPEEWGARGTVLFFVLVVFSHFHWLLNHSQYLDPWEAKQRPFKDLSHQLNICKWYNIYIYIHIIYIDIDKISISTHKFPPVGMGNSEFRNSLKQPLVPPQSCSWKVWS